MSKNTHSDQLLPVHLLHRYNKYMYMYIDILIHSDTRILHFISTIKKFDSIHRTFKFLNSLKFYPGEHKVHNQW